MKPTELTYLVAGLIVFLGLFSFMDAPLLKIPQAIIRGAADVGYNVLKSTGMIRDSQVCSLFDMWNLGGGEVTTDAGNNVSCALLTEEGIAMTPGEVEKLGEGTEMVESVVITNARSRNTVLYAVAVFLILAFSAIITDFLLSTGIVRPTAARAMGILMTSWIATSLLLMRVAPLWDGLTATIKMLPGSSLIANGLTIVFVVALLGFAASHIRLAYETTKKSYDTFKSVKLATTADLRRGQMVLEEAEKNR